MMRSELCEQLRKQGLVIEGPDPEMVISSTLWRAGDAAGIVRLTRGDGYWLKEMPWQPSGYDPADEKTATVRRALAQHFDEPDVADDGSDTLAKQYSWRGIIAAVCRGFE